MFGLGYAVKELRRRLGRTVLTALGLAAGVGLVIGIIGVSRGLDRAQAKVLAPLSSVGTDILVTRVAGGTTTSASASPTPTPSQGTGVAPAFGFFGGPGGQGGPGGAGPSALNAQDTQALLQENSNIVTDLSKLGKPGERFTHDFFLSATLLSFPQEAVQQIASIKGVDTAVGGLTQLATHQTGTVPEIVAELQTGGETFTQTAAPAPLNDAERAEVEACFERNRPTAPPTPGQGPRGGVVECLPERFRNFRFSFTTPLRTLRQVINPPSTDITSTTYTAAGIDPSNENVGLVTKEQLSSGRWLGTDAIDEVLVSVAYANKNTIAVGGTIPINGTDFTVVGLVSPTLTGATADIYFPLGALQQLATKTGRVTQVLVKATDASKVDAVAAEIRKQLPGAEVVTTKSLSDQVTGSLADAKKVASRFGGAVGAIVLGAAFAIAMLLTLSSVAKRVREIGTLRAIGWSKRRVVRQILTETVGMGVLGGAIGIGLGIATAVAVAQFSPALSATTSGVPSFGSSSLLQIFGQQSSASQTATVALTAPLTLWTLLVGVGFAIVGGLLAGAVGGWRAARMSPADALRNLG